MRFQAVFTILAAFILAFVVADVQRVHGNAKKDLGAHQADTLVVDSFPDKPDVIIVTATVTVNECKCTTLATPATVSTTFPSAPPAVPATPLVPTIPAVSVATSSTKTPPGVTGTGTPTVPASSVPVASTPAHGSVTSTSVTESHTVASLTSSSTPVGSVPTTAKTTGPSPSASHAVASGAAVQHRAQVGAGVLAGVAVAMFALA